MTITRCAECGMQDPPELHTFLHCELFQLGHDKPEEYLASHGYSRPVERRHRFMTVQEVAELMRVSTMTVYRMLERGDFTKVRVGKHFRIRSDEVRGVLGL
jgi:excisionase family DNA binding protein